MNRKTIAAVFIFALLLIPMTLPAGTPNPFSQETKEYGLIENTDGSLTIFGRLTPGDVFDKLPNFTDAQIPQSYDNWLPQFRQRAKNEKILIWVEGPYQTCVTPTCFLPIIAHCWHAQTNSERGNLFTCTMLNTDIQVLKNSLIQGKAFTSFWCQSAHEQIGLSAKLISPRINWGDAKTNESKDTDTDGVPDYRDNCPDKANKDQSDANANGVGDVCENIDFSYTPPPAPPDTDKDGWQDSVDKCPGVANVSNADKDNDGVGDECDKCPDQAGLASNNGCPEEEAKAPTPSQAPVVPQKADTGWGCSLIIR